MEGHFLTNELIHDYEEFMILEEKSKSTIEKYIRDVTSFATFLHSREVNKQVVVEYKQKLITDGYAPRSVNSMLASINHFFSWQNWYECKVKALKVQQQVFWPEEKELTKKEYERLCSVAEKNQNKRLSLLIQTICGTGIRVSELVYITVSAVKNGKAFVSSKGKTRTVFIIKALKKKLIAYAIEHKITAGPIFVTKSGTPMNRTNIWREMKSICEEAGVDSRKVFPHNLRHLFARVFYSYDKDLAKLADILGHESIDTTRIYIISTGKEHRQRMEQLMLVK